MHQSNPLEHGASASDQSDSFQSEASFSFTAGRKQLDTRKSQGRWESQRWRTHEGPKDKIELTYSRSSWGGLLLLWQNKNTARMICANWHWACERPSADAEILSLLMGWSWSAGLISKRLQPIISWLWSTCGAVWYSDVSTLLPSWLVIGQYVWPLLQALRRCSQDWTWGVCLAARL